jgi:ankyrin repeat protein
MQRAIFIGVATASVFCSMSLADRNPYAAFIQPVLCSDVPTIGVAAYRGDVPALRHLISSGANLESVGKDKRAPLLLASAGGHLEAVSALLKAGGKINARDSSGETALHWAAIRGEEKIALLLLRHHAEPNVQDEFGETPLIFAALAGSKTIVEALLASGAKRDSVDIDKLSASAYAKMNNFSDIALLLDKPR